MAQKIYTLALIFLMLACSQKESTNETTGSEALVSETIDALEFQNKINTTKDPVILDVRTPGEYSSGYIEGAVNLDFMAEDFNAKVEELDKDATYFVYCAGGGRSGKAADLMKQLNFKKVYDLEGGMTQWKANDLPTKQP